MRAKFQLWHSTVAPNELATALKQKNETIKQLQEENREYLAIITSDTSLITRLVDSNIDRYEEGIRSSEEKREYRATIEKQEKKIRSLEVEVERLRSQNAALTSPSDGEAGSE